tara:strand:+ start:419 stop:616 length:198 start_codon:yes stop_codon:yes gene_type:complete
MAIIYKKLNEPDGTTERTDYICKVVTDDSDNVLTDSWIPTNANNKDYVEYQEWEAIDGNTIAEAD